MGQTYTPVASADDYRESGIASWYGRKFHGRLTASGEIYNMYKLTAAHRILPMQTMVEVTNRDNGRHVVVRVNDRGPFVNNRILDLSYEAAKQLDVVGPGTARVNIEAFGTHKKDLKGPFYVQVGSFTIAKNATKLQIKLMQEGYSQTRIHQIVLSATTYWQVHAGTFQTLDEAENARHHLFRENPSCFILAD
jgi:rare lipoprotein A